MRKRSWKCEVCGSYQNKKDRIVRRFCCDECSVKAGNNKWTTLEDNLLKENFNIEKENLLALFPSRSWWSIYNRAHYYLKLIRKSDRCWTETELNTLAQNYNTMPTKLLIKSLPRKSYEAIKLKANSLGLNRTYNSSRMGDLRPLLLDNAITYYWLGFLFADGHFDRHAGRLTLTLSIKDKEHMRKLMQFLHHKNDIKEFKNGNRLYCGVAVADKLVINELCEKFSICNRKTYIPPDISSIIDDDLLTSFIVGFIDGDGCVKKQTNRKDHAISIKCYSSWLPLLQKMANFIYSRVEVKPPQAHLNVQGYAIVNMANYRPLNNLKKEAIRLELPYLARKWDKINVDEKFDGIMCDNLIDMKFGNFTVIEKLTSDKQRSMRWNCICDCGNKFICNTKELKRRGKENCKCKCSKKGGGANV